MTHGAAARVESPLHQPAAGPPPRAGEDKHGAAGAHPPRNREGDRAKRGGGGRVQLQRPIVYTARRLRKSLSPAEAKLWRFLRGKPNGYKFRLQHPLELYVADFCCVSAKLIVEVDGAGHNGAGALRDEVRDAALRARGYDIFRIPAADVMSDIASVFAAIMVRVGSPLRQPAAGPPPRSGEDS